MARKTPPALARIAVLLALALLIAACGGGSTAGPIASSPAATTPAAAQAQTQTLPAAAAPTTETTPAVPSTTTAEPAPRPTSQPRTSRPRSTSGAAAAPSESPGAGAPGEAPVRVAGEPSTAPADEPASDSQSSTSPLDERAKLVLTRRVSPSHYFQQGTVTGTYDGTMAIEARITSRGVLVRFTATLPGGTISGRGVVVAILDSTTWPGLRGRALVTGGTGRFAGIHGRALKVTGRSKPDASRAHVRLAGLVVH